MLTLSLGAVRAILTHAEANPTTEVCGLVWASTGGAQRARPLRNVHPDPARYYRVDPTELMTAYTELEAGLGGDPVGFYHSHPGGKPDPSEEDMLGAMNVGHHYLIAYPDEQTMYAGPARWQLSVWECIAHQVLVEDTYEVRS